MHERWPTPHEEELRIFVTDNDTNPKQAFSRYNRQHDRHPDEEVIADKIRTRTEILLKLTEGERKEIMLLGKLHPNYAVQIVKSRSFEEFMQQVQNATIAIRMGETSYECNISQQAGKGSEKVEVRRFFWEKGQNVFKSLVLMQRSDGLTTYSSNFHDPADIDFALGKR